MIDNAELDDQMSRASLGNPKANQLDIFRDAIRRVARREMRWNRGRGLRLLVGRRGRRAAHQEYRQEQPSKPHRIYHSGRDTLSQRRFQWRTKLKILHSMTNHATF